MLPTSGLLDGDQGRLDEGGWGPSPAVIPASGQQQVAAGPMTINGAPAAKSKREPSPRTRKRLHCLDSVRGLNVMLPGPRTDHTCSDFGTRTIAFFLDAEPKNRTIVICDVKETT